MNIERYSFHFDGIISLGVHSYSTSTRRHISRKLRDFIDVVQNSLKVLCLDASSIIDGNYG
jgi:hypothetical protein